MNMNIKLENNISTLGLYAGKSNPELKEKLLNLAEEMAENISKLRRVANGCATHKSYRGVKEVTSDCKDCDDIYQSRQFLGE